MKGGDINLDLLGIAIVPLFVHFVVLIWYMGNGVFIFSIVVAMSARRLVACEERDTPLCHLGSDIYCNKQLASTES